MIQQEENRKQEVIVRRRAGEILCWRTAWV